MKIMKAFCVVALLAGLVSVATGAETDKEKEKKAQAAALQVRMTIQAICPVSGQKLGGHGTPVRVKIGAEEVFLCCKGCAKGKVDAKHWATIHANFAKAQRICPVMKNELPKDAKWTIVEGRIVYVCCPPCIKKLEADPKTYLKKVDELYLESIKEREKKEKEKASAK
jgi:hypothetical protein